MSDNPKSIEEFALGIGQDRAIACLDVGSKKIGIAVSDQRCRIASPLTTIRRRKFSQDAEQLLALISEREIAGLIIGLPMNMNGTEGPACQSVRSFAGNLAAFTTIPISFWDERLSTVAAERELISAGMSRKQRSRRVDQVAAALILQVVLDYLAGTGANA